MKIIEKIRELTNKDNKTWEQPIARKFFRPMAVEIETGQFLYGLVRAVKPTNAVETGTFEGFSAVNIAQALKDNKKGMLWTIDCQDYGAQKIFDNYKVKAWINPVLGFSPAILKEIVSREDIDFAFLDGEHTGNAVLAELEILHEYFKAGSYITGHDYIRYDEIKQAVDNFVSKHQGEYEKTIITTFAGIFVLRKIH